MVDREDECVLCVIVTVGNDVDDDIEKDGALVAIV